MAWGKHNRSLKEESNTLCWLVQVWHTSPPLLSFILTHMEDTDSLYKVGSHNESFLLPDGIKSPEQSGGHAPKHPAGVVTPSLSQVRLSSQIWLMCTLQYLTHQMQHTMWPEGWISSSAAAVKSRETLWWVWQVEPTPGRNLIHLSLSQVIQKIWEDRKRGGCYWLPSWLKRAALERTHLCFHVAIFTALLTWQEVEISSIQGLTSPVRSLLWRREKTLSIAAQPQKWSKRCGY